MASQPRANIGSRDGSPPGQLAREVSSLQATLLSKLHDEMSDGDGALFAETAQNLAEAFGSVTATAVGALWERTDGTKEEESLTSLFQPGHMRRRLDQLVELNKRYGLPFGLVVFDVEGPGTRASAENGGQETVLAVVGAALRDSIRLVDEAFRLEEAALCVLAPNQTTVEGVQMADRLMRMLDALEAVGGLAVTISAGVVACPEHGADADRLLHKADEAMWRARSLGQPIGVGVLQDR